jgi:hypothetical protein
MNDETLANQLFQRRKRSGIEKANQKGNFRLLHSLRRSE